MTTVDWIALAFVAVTGLLGLKKGLIASALSLAGIVVGAIVGARLAPHLLTGGSTSPYTPLAGLAGAAVGAVLLETIGTMAGRTLRGSLPARPLRTLDSLGGLVLGAAAGLALVWVVGASALLVPGQTSLRRGAQQSLVLRKLYERVPPAKFMRLLARVDPFPAIAGPASPVEPPDPALLHSPGVRQAAPSVVRVLGTACGLRIAGSGWVAKPSLVVTAAHVVAGQKDTVVEKPGSGRKFDATVVVLDPRNDIAVLRVRGLGLRALPIASPRAGHAVAILGYPENGPLGGSRSARADDRSAERGRVRARPGAAEDHERARQRPPRRLRRAGRRSARRRRGDDVRRAARERGRLRRAERHRAQRPAARPRSHIDRGVRELNEQVERRLGPAERRDDVDPLCLLARLLHQPTRERRADVGGLRSRGFERALHVLGDDHPRHLVVDAPRELQARQRPDADEQRDRGLAAEPLEERVEVRDVEEHLRHRELRARVELALEALELHVEVVGGRVHRDADVEGRRRVDRAAVEVLTAIEVCDQVGEPDRVDFVDAAAGAGVVRFLGRIAGDREDVAHAFGVRAEQLRLEAR